jgi:NADH:ubiquinone oxidoreductase subunit 6 (subunit J)
MDVLFSLGALFIGIRVRYWAAAAIAALHLTAVTLAIVALAAKKGPLVIPSNVLYLGAIIAAVVFYLRGRRLPKDHERRETCELLGAVGFIGAIAAIIVVIVTASGSSIFRP